MLKNIIKRDGRVVLYDETKIANAILKAMEATREGGPEAAVEVANDVERILQEKNTGKIPQVEEIQDAVEVALMRHGFENAAKSYILYRAERTRTREKKTRLMRIFDELTFTDANNSDMKRDNANIDGDTAMGTMLKYGCEGAKDYYEKHLLTPEQAEAHHNGDIHIHDFDFYALTTTCCQIDLLKLFKGGFSTGHGFLREPNDIQSYSALACIAIQSNQNDQHGGQSIVNFDYGLAPGVAKTYRKNHLVNLCKAAQLLAPERRLELQAFKDMAAEIQATLEGACRMTHKKLWCVFQCNSYTRAKTLFTGTVTCFNQAEAATGRLSSLNPNLQNIPVRTEEGRKIRKAFVTGDPDFCFFSADYSQVELRLMAHLSGDDALRGAFLHGEDVHAETAAKIYHVPLAEVTPEMRRRAKTANFGIIYGISAWGLAERLKISRKEGKELIDGYFELYPGVKRYMEESVEKARRQGYVETIMGRRRYLRDINSRNAVVRGVAERNAINAPIQGSAADIIKKAMIQIHARMVERGMRSRMILQVHDELNFKCYRPELEDLKALVVDCMEHVVALSVPLTVSTGVGENWYEAH